MGSPAPADRLPCPGHDRDPLRSGRRGAGRWGHLLLRPTAPGATEIKGGRDGEPLPGGGHGPEARPGGHDRRRKSERGCTASGKARRRDLRLQGETTPGDTHRDTGTGGKDRGTKGGRASCHGTGTDRGTLLLPVTKRLPRQEEGPLRTVARPPHGCRSGDPHRRCRIACGIREHSRRCRDPLSPLCRRGGTPPLPRRHHLRKGPRRHGESEDQTPQASGETTGGTGGPRLLGRRCSLPPGPPYPRRY